MRNMLRVLLATTALASMAGVAHASNYINFDNTGGSVTALAIQQKPSNPNNSVGDSVTPSPFQAQGAWNAISITQTGNAGTNALTGTIASGAADNTASSISATYTASANGGNTHSLTIGGVENDGPTSVENYAGTAGMSVSMDATNAPASSAPNEAIDILNTDGALKYTLAVAGGGNTVHNTITGADSIALSISATGNGNTVTTNSSGSGNKDIKVSLASDGNTASIDFGSTAGNQTSYFTGDGTSQVDYTMTSSASDTTANINLNNVTGNATPALVGVEQGSSATGATANLTVNGITGYAADFQMLPGGGVTVNYGIYVKQNSATASLTAIVNSVGTGYTVAFTQ